MTTISFKEDMGEYQDGKVLENPATAVAYTKDKIVYINKDNVIYFSRTDDPYMFELGTVEEASVLETLDNQPFQNEILRALKEAGYDFQD